MLPVSSRANVENSPTKAMSRTERAIQPQGDRTVQQSLRQRCCRCLSAPAKGGSSRPAPVIQEGNGQS